MSLQGAFELDPRAVAARFARAAAGYGQADVLAREVAQRMASRLALIKRVPSRLLDLGCGTGADEALLTTHYPEAEIVGVDVSWPMLREGAPRQSRWARLSAWLGAGHGQPSRVCAPAEQLPFAGNSFGMIWSNLMLHHVSDPMPVFREAHRVLEVEGLLMFACLGPDTLKELRAVAPDRVHRFIDMHDLGDMLVAAGFAEPVMDMETITLTYADFDTLVADLRRAGGACAAAARPRGLCGKGAWHALREDYERQRVAGRLPATMEIVYGHAWKPAPRTTPEGHAIVRFDPSSRRR